METTFTSSLVVMEKCLSLYISSLKCQRKVEEFFCEFATVQSILHGNDRSLQIEKTKMSNILYMDGMRVLQLLQRRRLNFFLISHFTSLTVHISSISFPASIVGNLENFKKNKSNDAKAEIRAKQCSSIYNFSNAQFPSSSIPRAFQILQNLNFLFNCHQLWLNFSPFKNDFVDKVCSARVTSFRFFHFLFTLQEQQVFLMGN